MSLKYLQQNVNFTENSEKYATCALSLNPLSHGLSFNYVGNIHDRNCCKCTRTVPLLGSIAWPSIFTALLWRHNGHDGVSNHQPCDYLLNRLFRRRSKKTSKLRVTGLCAGNSPVTGEFPAQMTSYAENVSTWWRHHGVIGPVTSPLR